MKKEVKIVVVGEAQVGKTSLITVMLTDVFQEKTPSVIPPVVISREVTSDKVITHIIDTSSRPDEFPTEEIKQADAICVVYDYNRKETFDKIQTFWLPEIAKVRESLLKENSNNGKIKFSKIPIIVVGNKIDLPCDIIDKNDVDKEFTEEEKYAITLEDLMLAFPEIETCIECSAKRLEHIQEVFYIAQKAVLYPSGPIYNYDLKQMTNEATEAITRIFYIFDKDKDNALSDHELKEYQEKCFGKTLSDEDVKEIKKKIHLCCANGLDNTGITLTGFLYLYTLFIYKGQYEVIWKTFSKFGYGLKLKLKKSFLYPNLDVKDYETCELSSQGYDFFKEQFRLCDKDEDGALNNEEFESLFRVVLPRKIPWTKEIINSCVKTDQKGNLTLSGFLGLWSLMTLENYSETLSYLALLGFEGDTRQGITVTKGRKSDLKKKKITRNVFRCYVFGSKGCGKTTFLRGLIGKNFDPEYISTTKVYKVIGTTYPPESRDFQPYLTLYEFPNEEEIIKSKMEMEKCDLVCLLYDGNNEKSFEYIAKIQKMLKDNYNNIPCAYFMTKSDLPKVKQTNETSPEEWCAALKYPLRFISFKTINEESKLEIYNTLTQQIIDEYKIKPFSWKFIGVSILAVGTIAGMVWLLKKK